MTVQGPVSATAPWVYYIDRWSLVSACATDGSIFVDLTIEASSAGVLSIVAPIDSMRYTVIF